MPAHGTEPPHPRYPDLTAWLQRHRALDESLARLRRVAPEGDPTRTAAALRALDDRLRLHMAQEEAHLLPAYAPLAEALPANAAPRVLRADHDRIRELLDRLGTLVDPRSADALLQRDEALALLAGTLEHHDRREARWFKPTLDAHVDAATRRAWLGQFAAEEDALAPAPPEDLRPAPPPQHTSPDPLRAMALAVAQDAPLAGPWARVPVPDHPKGARLHAAVGALVTAAEQSPNLPAHRDALAALADRLRLLSLLRGPPDTE